MVNNTKKLLLALTITLVSLKSYNVWGYEDDDSGDSKAEISAYKDLQYKCAKGTKVFKTKIVKTSQGEYDKVANIEVMIKVESEKMEPKLKLFVEGKESSTGEGQVAWSIHADSAGNFIPLAKILEAKMKTSTEDSIKLGASLEINSGSCVASIPLVAEAPRILGEDIIAQASKVQQANAMNAKCLTELNKPDMRAAYLNSYLCILDECDQISAKLRNQEAVKAKHSGYENKILLYGLGNFKVTSSKERAVAVAGINALGGSTTCKVQASKVSTNFFVNLYGHPICMASIPAASVSKNKCFAEMYSDGSVSYWAGNTEKIKQIANSGWNKDTKPYSADKRESEEDESKLDPDIIVARRKVAQLKEAAKWDINEAVQAGKDPLIVDLNKVEALKEAQENFDHAYSYSASSRLETAEKLYKVSSPNRDPKFITKFVEILVDNDNLQKAVDILKIEKFPGDAETARLKMLASLSILAGDKTTGLATADALASLQPDNVKSALLPAATAAVFKDFETASKKITAVQEKFPKSPEPKLTLGHVLFLSGNSGEAIKIYEKVIEDNPENVQALNNLSYILARENKDLKKAQKLIEKAIENNKDKDKAVELNGTLGFVLLQRDEPEDAIPLLHKAYQQNLTDVDVIRDLAKAYVATKKTQDAINLYTYAAKEKYITQDDKDALLKEVEALKARVPAEE